MRVERIRARVVWYHAHVAQLHIMVDAQERATSLWGDTTFRIRKNDGQLLWTSFSRNQCLLKETTWKKIMLSQKVLLGYCNMWLLQFTITEHCRSLSLLFLDENSRTQGEGEAISKLDSGFKSDLCRIKFYQHSPRAWRWRMSLMIAHHRHLRLGVKNGDIVGSPTATAAVETTTAEGLRCLFR